MPTPYGISSSTGYRDATVAYRGAVPYRGVPAYPPIDLSRIGNSEVHLVDSTGDELATLSPAVVESVTWTRFDVGSAQVSIHPLAPYLDYLKLAEVEIQIEVDGQLWWGVPLTVDGGVDSMVIGCDDLMRYFDSRFVLNATLTYDNIDQSTILANLVTEAQTGVGFHRNRNITIGAYTPSGHKRYREYKRDSHDNFLKIIQEFSTLDDGAGFQLKVYKDGRREFWPVYPLSGTLKSDYVLEWGRNIVDLHYQETAVNLADRVYVTGGSNGDVRFEENYYDPIRGAKYGDWERVISAGSQKDVNWLDARAKKEVAKNGQPVKLPQLVCSNDPQQLFGNIWPGDIVPVQIDHGYYQVNDNYMINAITWTPDGVIGVDVVQVDS